MLMLLSPIILAVLVVVFGLFPGLLTQSIVEPATTSGMSNVNANSTYSMVLRLISTLIIWILVFYY